MKRSYYFLSRRRFSSLLAYRRVACLKTTIDRNIKLDSMAGSDTIIAMVALLVSIVALLVTMAQFLASMFATAGGRHKCSTSVMGAWGYLTRVKRHWTEFRFEVMFVSPDILLKDSTELQPLEAPKNRSSWLSDRKASLTGGSASTTYDGVLSTPGRWTKILLAGLRLSSK